MSTYPPDGYYVSGTDVTWALDFDIETTIFLSGTHSVKIKSRAPAAQPSGNPMYGTLKLIPCTAGEVYTCEWRVRADSIAAGNLVYCYFYWYDATKAYLSNTSVWAAVLDAADTWQLIKGTIVAPTSAAFVRIVCFKKNTDFNLYIDSMIISRHPVAFETWLTTDTVMGSGTIAFDNEVYDYGGCLAAGVFTVPVPGIYAFTAYALTSDTGAGEAWWMEIIVASSGGGTATKAEAYHVVETLGDGLAMNTSAAGVLIAAGATVYVTLKWDGGGNNTIGAARFYGAKIG